MRKSLTSRLLSAIGLAGIEGIISQREPAVKVRKYAKGHDHEAAKKSCRYQAPAPSTAQYLASRKRRVSGLAYYLPAASQWRARLR